MAVSQIKPHEPVMLDTDLLDQLCVRLGYAKAENAINTAMEDLAVLLQYAGTLYRAQDLETLYVTCRQIRSVADRVGMAKLARVARDVSTLCHGADPNSLGATVARLRRLGEQSLIAIWDREDLTI